MKLIIKAMSLLACLAFLMPTASAGVDPDEVIIKIYEEVAAAAIDAATCGWSTLRAYMIGAGQDATPVNYAEGLYNVAVRDPLVGVLYGDAAYGVVGTINVVSGPGAYTVLAFANDSYTYSKCTVAHYTTWAAQNYVWFQPTVDCFFVQSDCGQDNVYCNVDRAGDFALAAPFVLFGDPAPSTEFCIPPAGIYCVCLPPENPRAVPNPPNLLELLS